MRPLRTTVRAGIALVAMSCATAIIMTASPVHAATRSDRAAVHQHGSNQANPQGVDVHGQPLTSPRTKLNTAVLAASMGPLITRSEIINRAQSWADVPVPYSQNAYRDGYRTDCSGYVSMAWKTNGNYWTGPGSGDILPNISYTIGYNDLRPGDILLHQDYADPVNGSHVVIFDHWISQVGGDFVIYEQTPPNTRHRAWSSTGYSRTAYQPYRYYNVIDDHVYGLSPDKGSVSVWNGSGTGPGSWTVIGGVATRLYAGGAGLFATNPNDGSINKYNGTPGSWTIIGGPGAEYAVSNDRLYGLTPDHAHVSVWNGTPGSWTVIGGVATHLYAGGAGLFATNPNDGSINKYNGTPGSWTIIGGPGNSYAVGDSRLYGLAYDKSSVSVWNGTPGSWTAIGGPADSIAAD